MENNSAPFYVSTQIQVRFADCDMFGHMNNAKFITFMEQARVEYFKTFPEINFLKRVENPELSIILAEVTCTYKSPVLLDEVLVVKIRTTELKRSSFVMEYEMTEEKSGRLTATGKTIGVFYNYQAEKSIPIPEEIRRRFEKAEKRKFV